MAYDWNRFRRKTKYRSQSSMTVFLLFLMSLLSLAIPRDAETVKEMILIINIDTLRFDEHGIYGNRRNLTPHLDELAKKEGVVFDEAFAASDHTRPSVASLFTGMYPTNHGFWHLKSNPKIKEPNISTVMPQDYVTIYVNANPNTAYLFNEYFKYSWSEYPVDDPKYADSAYYPAEYVFDKALDYLKKTNLPSKVFLYIQPADPHDPYYPLKRYPNLFEGDVLKDTYSGKYKTELSGLFWDENLPKRTAAEIANIKNRYDAEVRYLDEQMFRFLEEIRQKYNKILFFFTSDHGESFLDHNDANHGGSLYNEQIKIPFIIIDTEKRFGKPRRTSDLISNVDLLPTLADVVGFNQTLKPDGISLFKIIDNFDGFFPLKKSRTIVSEVVHSSETVEIDKIEDSKANKIFNSLIKKPINVLIRATIRYEKGLFHKTLYKYINNENSDEAKLLLQTQKLFFHTHDNELYLISLDHKEQKNLIGKKAKIAQDILNTSPLRGKFPEFILSDKKLSKEEIERLKSLGYIK